MELSAGQRLFEADARRPSKIDRWIVDAWKGLAENRRLHELRPRVTDFSVIHELFTGLGEESAIG